MAVPGVHIEFIKHLGGLVGISAQGTPVPSSSAPIVHVEDMTALDLAIGAAAVQIPAGVTAIELSSPSATAYRYAVGGANTVTVAASNALRHDPAGGPQTLGVTPLTWLITAADTEI